MGVLEISLGDGRRMRLGQVATVRDTIAERGSILRQPHARAKASQDYCNPPDAPTYSIP